MQIKLNKIKNKWWGSSSSSSVTFWNALLLAWLWIGVLDVGFGGFGLRTVDGAAVQTNNSVLGSSSPTEETSVSGTGTTRSPPPVPVPVQIQIQSGGSSSDHANKRDHAGSSRSFTPSISELSVPFRDNPKIILGNFPGNSVVLPLLNGEVSASNYLVHLARQAGNSDPGYFIVEAPKNYGVMAVIQQLHLRRISDSKSLLQLVNNCKDYVVFEGHNGEKTIPICGTLEKGDNSFYPANLHGPKFFNSPNGRIKVTFRNHYSYGNDLVSQNESDEQQNQEMIMVEIAFTAYSNCTTADEAKGKFQCTLEKCIDSQLECDKTVNCAPGENQSRFGVDETNCTRSSPTPPTGTGTGASKTARPEPRNHANHDPADHNPHHENSQIAHNRNNNGKYHQHHHHLQLQQQLQGRRFDIQVGKEEEDEEDSNLSTFLDDDELLPVSIFNQPKNPISTKPNKSPTTAGSNSHNSKTNHHHHNNNENENNNLSSEPSDDDNNNTSPNNSDPNEDNSRLPNLTTIIILVIILALVTICGYFWSWVSQFLCAARSLLRSAEVGVVQQQQQQHQQQQSHVDNNNVSSSHNHNNSQGTGTGAGGTDQQQHHPRLPIAYYVPAVVLRTTSSSHRNHHHHHHNNHINSIQAVNSLNSSAGGDKKMSEADSPPPSYELLFPGPISGSGDSTKIANPVTVTKQMHDMKE